MTVRILAVLLLFSHSTLQAAPSRCKPDGICTACKDCSKCSWCAKTGKGSCSVCQNQTPAQARRREAIKERHRR